MEDFQEIVKKFLSRENTYSQLLDAVTDGEKHRETVKLENEKLSEELQAKKIELDGLLGKDEESDVFKLKKEIEALSKDEQSLLEKYQKCSIVYDQLRSWVIKIYKILLSILEKSPKHAAQLEQIRKIDFAKTETLFSEMCEVLGVLIDTYAQDKTEKITIKALAGQDEFYNDQAYKDKNVRVRPSTKPTMRRDDSFRSGTDMPVSTPAVPQPVLDSEKEQKEINSEFQDERKKIRQDIKKTVFVLFIIPFSKPT